MPYLKEIEKSKLESDNSCKCLMACDINTNSLIQYFHFNKRQNAPVIKELSDQFDLLNNNEDRHFTRQRSKSVSAIDFTLTIFKFSSSNL